MMKGEGREIKRDTYREQGRETCAKREMLRGREGRMGTAREDNLTAGKSESLKTETE